MRKDIYEEVLPFIMTHTKPNYAALTKHYNYDYRTVKRYYEAGISNKFLYSLYTFRRQFVDDILVQKQYDTYISILCVINCLCLFSYIF